MTAQEALQSAIEFFEQRDETSADYWQFTRTTREEIAAGLRELLPPTSAGEPMTEVRAMLAKSYDHATKRAEALAMANVYGKSADERREITRLYNEAMDDAARAAAALDACDAANQSNSTKEKP